MTPCRTYGVLQLLHWDMTGLLVSYVLGFLFTPNNTATVILSHVLLWIVKATSAALTLLLGHLC